MTGKKTDNMGTVLKHGLTTLNTKATMNMGRNTEWEHSNGQMVLRISANFATTTSMGKECILGRTIGSMKVNGVETKCTEKERLHGLTGGNMSVNTLTIKRRAMENSSGQMDGAIEENG